MVPVVRGENQGRVAELVLGILVGEEDGFCDAFELSAAHEF